MFKRAVSLGLIGAILLVSLLTVSSALAAGRSPDGLFDVVNWANQAVKTRMEKYDLLQQIAPALLLNAGAKEKDGIFITENYLLENIAPEDPLLVSENIARIDEFLTQHNLPAVFMLIPTACAIKQQELPTNANLFNQKALISNVYAELEGLVTAIDAYTALFSAKDQYTYYRTESNLTGLGGYYLYSALAPRLGFSARPLDQFEIEHLEADYYGDLYQRSNYKGIRPDLVTLYRFSRYERQYLLAHTDQGQVKNYYSLFPTHLAALGSPVSALLGGVGQRLDISVVSPFAESILIFGDETATAYLPFLAVHYGTITLIDLSKATTEQLSAVSLDNYNRVMFAYSVDSFINGRFDEKLMAIS